MIIILISTKTIFVVKELFVVHFISTIKTNSTISMNYLSDYQNKNFENAKHIKLIVKNNMFEKCLNKLLDLTHENIVVVAGNWNSSNEEDVLAECEIYSVGKQICNA